MNIYSDRLKISCAASSSRNRPHRSAVTLPGDFTTYPCPEDFSLDLATTFILQKALMKLFNTVLI